jgi:hypothetical protein
VNYIGHPLEGSVSGNIFYSERSGRTLGSVREIGAYWRSRMKAMAWAAAVLGVFRDWPGAKRSRDRQRRRLTPTLPHCGFYPTCPKEPGKATKPPTNNTGWVDFVVTPVIGTGWLILEDFLEANLVDKLAEREPDLKFKILRGALDAEPHDVEIFWRDGRRGTGRTSTREVVSGVGSPVQPVADYAGLERRSAVEPGRAS